eukprot:25166_1
MLHVLSQFLNYTTIINNSTVLNYWSDYNPIDGSSEYVTGINGHPINQPSEVRMVRDDNRVTYPRLIKYTTYNPTVKPTTTPTTKPTNAPTNKPTVQPTHNPTVKPTKQPAITPTQRPTKTPTTRKPTHNPTSKPTQAPTTNRPTKQPTIKPTKLPTTSRKPTQHPTIANNSKPELDDAHSARMHRNVQSLTISLYLNADSQLDDKLFRNQLIHHNYQSLVIVPRVSDLKIQDRYLSDYTSGHKRVRSYYDTPSIVLMKLTEWMTILTDWSGLHLDWSAFVSDTIKLFHELDRGGSNIIYRDMLAICGRKKHTLQQNAILDLFRKSLITKHEVKFPAKMVREAFGIFKAFLDASATYYYNVLFRETDQMLDKLASKLSFKQNYHDYLVSLKHQFFILWKDATLNAKTIVEAIHTGAFQPFTTGKLLRNFGGISFNVSNNVQKVINFKRCVKIASIIDTWQMQNMLNKSDAIHIYFGNNKMVQMASNWFTLLEELSADITGNRSIWEPYIVHPHGATTGIQSPFHGFMIKRVNRDEIGTARQALRRLEIVYLAVVVVCLGCMLLKHLLY